MVAQHELRAERRAIAMHGKLTKPLICADHEFCLGQVPQSPIEYNQKPAKPEIEASDYNFRRKTNRGPPVTETVIPNIISVSKAERPSSVGYELTIFSRSPVGSI